MTRIIAVAGFAVLLVVVTSPHAGGRTWTDRKGRKVEAKFVGFEDGKVSIKRESDGKTFRVPLERFSDEDQKFVKSQSHGLKPNEEPRPDDVAAPTKPQTGASDAAVKVEIGAAGALKVDGAETPETALGTVIRDKAAAIRNAAESPQKPVVLIVADGDATYGRLKAVVAAAQKCRFEQFVLHVGDEILPFDAPLAAPAAGMPGPDDLPPIRVRLRADEDGSLDGIASLGKELPSLAALQQAFIEMVGNERRPGSIRENVEVNLVGDDDLKLEHLAAAHRAVSGYTAAAGNRVELIRKIRPISGGSGPVQLVEPAAMPEP